MNEIVIKRDEMRLDVKEAIKNFYAGLDPGISSVQKMKSIFSLVEDKFGEGWNIFGGTHYSGICTYVEKHYFEFEIGEGYRITLFKSFVPSKDT